MSWIPMHDSIFTDDWLNDLSESQRWAYFCFVLYARNQTPKWRVKRCKPEILARHLSLETVTFVTMLEAAVNSGKVTESDTGDKYWFLTNGKRYDFDETHAERQARYRLKKQEDKKEVTACDESDASDGNITGHNITRQDKTENSSSYEELSDSRTNHKPVDLDTIREKWNALAEELPPLAKIIAISGKRREAVRARLGERDFNLDKLLEAVRGSPFLRGQNNRNWVASFDWCIKATNWPKIIEGQYAGKQRGLERGAEKVGGVSAREFAERGAGRVNSETDF